MTFVPLFSTPCQLAATLAADFVLASESVWKPLPSITIISHILLNLRIYSKGSCLCIPWNKPLTTT